ncbi:hypothetical protein [Psychroserpens sp.]|uniref:hypothetical protein n=1 Tax=Psychroserpens sp. TaxID=2020870 RepID=UPI00385F2BAA
MEFEIKKYVISHMSNHGNTRHFIKLYDENEHRGILRFIDNGTTLPEPTMNRRGYITLNYYQEEFINVINTLRYEKPLYCHFLDHDVNHGFISTSREDVGDEE